MADRKLFSFMQRPDQEFIFELTDPAKIQEAQDILSGKETMKVHVMGRIVKSRKDYNPHWEYHLDPATINFFSVAIEVCDADMRYVQDHLDEVGGAFLPGFIWCPWNSRLHREVPA
ncbi:hypothetical protein [Archangium violaceum]|uniref:BP74 N-terminal domain-containing protein n=1 Tax=Archangium violaceum Cb vi76 TaxID=1406225 RepID=A0A084SQG1_9BACT|nr:hypothetical protein [Archangium violaceum]KFA90696.1 hypothetical protein Q664_26615 [Archangium violaceum Cb vi76]